MRKTFYLIVILSQVTATWLEDIPQKITQSNGQIVELYASGDQYSHRLHDENDYTIVLNPEDGNFYYAIKRSDEIIPSEFKAGLVDPSLTNLISGIKISQEQYLEKKE